MSVSRFAHDLQNGLFRLLDFFSEPFAALVVDLQAALVVVDPGLPQHVVNVARFVKRLVPRLPGNVPGIVFFGILCRTHHVDDSVVPTVAERGHVGDLQLVQQLLPVLWRHEGGTVHEAAVAHDDAVLLGALQLRDGHEVVLERNLNLHQSDLEHDLLLVCHLAIHRLDAGAAAPQKCRSLRHHEHLDALLRQILLDRGLSRRFAGARATGQANLSDVAGTLFHFCQRRAHEFPQF